MKYSAHPVEPEDRLGDDRAADQHAEVERDTVTRGIRALRNAWLM